MTDDPRGIEQQLHDSLVRLASQWPEPDRWEEIAGRVAGPPDVVLRPEREVDGRRGLASPAAVRGRRRALVPAAALVLVVMAGALAVVARDRSAHTAAVRTAAAEQARADAAACRSGLGDALAATLAGSRRSTQLQINDFQRAIDDVNRPLADLDKAIASTPASDPNYDKLLRQREQVDARISGPRQGIVDQLRQAQQRMALLALPRVDDDGTKAAIQRQIADFRKQLDSVDRPLADLDKQIAITPVNDPRYDTQMRQRQALAAAVAPEHADLANQLNEYQRRLKQLGLPGRQSSYRPSVARSTGASAAAVRKWIAIRHAPTGPIAKIADAERVAVCVLAIPVTGPLGARYFVLPARTAVLDEIAPVSTLLQQTPRSWPK